MNHELHNYLKFCLRSPHILPAIIRLLDKVNYWLINRISRFFPQAKKLFIPLNVRKKIDEASLFKIEIKNIKFAEPLISSTNLQLTNGFFTFESKADWLASFSDLETEYSLHRWNWLLLAHVSNKNLITRKVGLALIYSWLNQCLKDPKFGRDAYSTGERVVNGILFLLNSDVATIPDDILLAFSYMAKQIIANLEYHHQELTGNHAFNNGRALLFIGLVAEIPSIVSLGHEILKERLPKLVTHDGFMVEGSSHYHFLFTRWVLEIFWIAKRASNQVLVDLITPYARLLIKRCWFFLVFNEKTQDWEIPLIGDISPDFSPNWLISLPWSNLACQLYLPKSLPNKPRMSGWSDIFGYVKNQNQELKSFSAAYCDQFPDSGWYRINSFGWVVITHAESNSKGKFKASHAHDDLTSFVLYRNGIPIIIDTGRIDYTISLESRYGSSTFAHNTVTIDRFSPIVSGPSWICNGYRKINIDYKTEHYEDKTLISLSHDGFSRLVGYPVFHKRQMVLEKNSFSIEDYFWGQGNHDVDLRFHFSPLINLTNIGKDWISNDLGFCFQPDPLLKIQKLSRTNTSDLQEIGGISSFAYGNISENITFKLSKTIDFPCVFRQQIIFEN
jgi:hypothetical protein